MKTKDFNDHALELIEGIVSLAKTFNDPNINEFHFITKIWATMEIPIKNLNVVSDMEYDALSSYWFDNINMLVPKKGANDDDDDDTISISLTKSTNDILEEASKISKLLESKKITPKHIFFGAVKADSKVRIMLRDYGFTPSNVLMMDDDCVGIFTK